MFESVTLYNYTFVVQLCSPKSYNSNMFYHLFKLVTKIYTTIILPYVLDAKNLRFVTNYAMAPRNYQRHAKISKWSTSDHNAVAWLLVMTSDHSSCAERLSCRRSLGTNSVVFQAQLGSFNRAWGRSYLVMIKITKIFITNYFEWNYVWSIF